MLGPAMVCILLAAGCKLPASASSLFEGCYDPLPGHPTANEKTAFIKAIGAYAQEAERLHGTPAAGLLAMAAQESGYGFTKTGRFANNLYGFKWNGKESAGNRSYWTLTCQPSWDKNNKYIKFGDRREGVIFVGMKLATLKDLGGGKRNYKAKTDRYVQDRKNGVDIKTAVNRWIDGIADAGYNYSPATYRKNIKKMAENLNSYQLSAAVTPLSGLEQPKPAPTPPAPTPDPTPPAPTIKLYDIEGVVHMMGNDDNRLGNAYITLNGVTYWSQETGYFIIEGLPAGRHTLVVTMEGFNDKTVTVEIVDRSVETYVSLSPN